MLNTVAAAFPFASHVAPERNTSITPFNAPSVSMILVLFASRIDRLRIVVTAFTCRFGLPEPKWGTSNGIAPASAIQVRLSESDFAKARSSQTTPLRSPIDCEEDNLLTRNDAVIFVASNAALFGLILLTLSLLPAVWNGIRCSRHHKAIRFFKAKLDTRLVCASI
ncbi:hypothetical protein CFOL_v3_20645 [Cephalotus follicularis]|uniref:Uncharacterized protein n=1 Tax=Cephalotus follicularis TaxID=3775 RepID=A0A1Q3CAR2_CEPFO|nr:hypothetical protein CFOL_v3_20645 [Cephalotus follicularis]